MGVALIPEASIKSFFLCARLWKRRMSARHQDLQGPIVLPSCEGTSGRAVRVMCRPTISYGSSGITSSLSHLGDESKRSTLEKKSTDLDADVKKRRETRTLTSSSREQSTRDMSYVVGDSRRLRVMYGYSCTGHGTNRLTKLRDENGSRTSVKICWRAIRSEELGG
jgi:hypothetical protein